MKSRLLVTAFLWLLALTGAPVSAQEMDAPQTTPPGTEAPAATPPAAETNKEPQETAQPQPLKVSGKIVVHVKRESNSRSAIPVTVAPKITFVLPKGDSGESTTDTPHEVTVDGTIDVWIVEEVVPQPHNVAVANTKSKPVRRKYIRSRNHRARPYIRKASHRRVHRATRRRHQPSSVGSTKLSKRTQSTERTAALIAKPSPPPPASTSAGTTLQQESLSLRNLGQTPIGTPPGKSDLLLGNNPAPTQSAPDTPTANTASTGGTFPSPASTARARANDLLIQLLPFLGVGLIASLTMIWWVVAPPRLHRKVIRHVAGFISLCRFWGRHHAAARKRAELQRIIAERLQQLLDLTPDERPDCPPAPPQNLRATVTFHSKPPHVEQRE